MRISSRLSQIRPSATMAVSARAGELAAQGKRIINLSMGEPDFDTPARVREAAKQALDKGFTRYTPGAGIPELRRAAAGYFKRRHGVDAPMEAAMVANGGKHALFNLLLALLDPGDQVVVPAPYWVSYPDMILLAGGEPVIASSPAERGFKIGPEDIDPLLTPRTRAIILNTPSNPTGAHYSQEELDALAAYALDRGLFVISDEVYDQFVFAPAQPSTLCGWWKRRPESFAVVNALSKAFCMTGWRVGFCLAHPDLIRAMATIQGQSTSGVCSFAQKGAVEALTGPWDELEAMHAVFARRRDLAMDLVSAWPDVFCPRPDGAFFLFPDVHRHYGGRIPDSAALCAYLLEEAGVALVPGSAFGDDRCIRISYPVQEEILTEAMDKVAKALRR